MLFILCGVFFLKGVGLFGELEHDNTRDSFVELGRTGLFKVDAEGDFQHFTDFVFEGAVFGGGGHTVTSFLRIEKTVPDRAGDRDRYGF